MECVADELSALTVGLRSVGRRESQVTAGAARTGGRESMLDDVLRMLRIAVDMVKMATGARGRTPGMRRVRGEGNVMAARRSGTERRTEQA